MRFNFGMRDHLFKDTTPDSTDFPDSTRIMFQPYASH